MGLTALGKADEKNTGKMGKILEKLMKKYWKMRKILEKFMKKYWKNAKKLEKSGKFVSPKSGNHVPSLVGGASMWAAVLRKGYPRDA